MSWGCIPPPRAWKPRIRWISCARWIARIFRATSSRRRFRSKNIPRSSGRRARNGLDIFARVGYNKRRFTDGFGRMIKCDDGNQRAKASSESRRCGASRWAEARLFSSRSIVGESSNPRRLSPVTGFGFLAAEGCFLQLNQGGTALSGAPVHDCHACRGAFFVLEKRCSLATRGEPVFRRLWRK